MGLGLMGASLASQLQQGGHKMTVRNRSPEKMNPFLVEGAEGANNVGAVTHGAVICESEGVGLDLYAQTLPETEYAHAYIDKIHNDDFLNTTATLSTWATAFQSTSRQAIDSGITNEVPQLMSSLFDRALAAGYGDEDVSALFKTMRKKLS